MISLTIGTLVSYLSVLVSPDVFKLSAGISVFIPVFIGLNLIVFFIYLFSRSVRMIVPLVLLALGFPFLKVTLAFHGQNDDQSSFSLLSYNVRWFTRGKVQDGNLIHDFVEQESPDVLCFQEFYPVKKHIETLKRLGDYQSVANQHSSNLAIFSKYPLLNQGLLLENSRFNNIQFADLLIEKDTVRVYNLHLQSMGINTSKLQDTEGIREGYEEVKTKFLDGAAVRARQIDTLMTHIEDCRYKILIAGDFNDVPFSFNHFRLKRSFTNAFEAAGSGFGMTYNGRLPFLRIDHQFYGEGIRATSFKTFNDIEHSDHFPILGIYALSD